MIHLKTIASWRSDSRWDTSEGELAIIISTNHYLGAQVIKRKIILNIVQV